MSRVFVAAGHGLDDLGAVSSYGVERDVAIAVVDQAFNLIAGQNKMGREVVKVPHNLKLEPTVSYINSNSKDAAHDLCIEVHLNSNAGNAGTGTETYYGLPALATEVHQEVVRVLGLPDRGVKNGNMFYFNNSTNAASCLVELGFINNRTDTAAIVARGGLALAKGIIRACGGTWVEKQPITPPVTETPVTEPVKPEVPETPVVVPPVVAPPVIIPENPDVKWLSAFRSALKAVLLAILNFVKVGKE